MTEERKQELNARYMAAAHAMQSGVAYLENTDPEHRKHFRVGINSAMCSIAATAQLLMDKGVFTEEEYWEMQIVWMEKERDKYAQLVSQATGVPSVNLY